MVGHRVSALPPICRQDFISRAQFRALVKHTCARSSVASCARGSDSDTPTVHRLASDVPRSSRARCAPSHRRLDNLEPGLSTSQRTFLEAVLVCAARASRMPRSAPRGSFGVTFALAHAAPRAEETADVAREFMEHIASRGRRVPLRRGCAARALAAPSRGAESSRCGAARANRPPRAARVRRGADHRSRLLPNVTPSADSTIGPAGPEEALPTPAEGLAAHHVPADADVPQAAGAEASDAATPRRAARSGLSSTLADGALPR